MVHLPLGEDSPVDWTAHCDQCGQQHTVRLSALDYDEFVYHPITRTHPTLERTEQSARDFFLKGACPNAIPDR